MFRTIVASIALAALGACDTFPTWDNPFMPPPIAVQVGETTAAAPIALVRNQTLVVTLEANVTTGYRWEVVGAVAPVLMQLGTADYAPRATQGAITGAPGDMTFRFRAQSAGTTTLELAYRRPFEPNAPAAKTLRYEIAVRG